MKHYKFYDAVCRERKLERITCDFCSQETNSLNNISIIASGFMKDVFDFCDECYKNKLTPWIDTELVHKEPIPQIIRNL